MHYAEFSLLNQNLDKHTRKKERQKKLISFKKYYQSCSTFIIFYLQFPLKQIWYTETSNKSFNKYDVKKSRVQNFSDNSMLLSTSVIVQFSYYSLFQQKCVSEIVHLGYWARKSIYEPAHSCSFAATLLPQAKLPHKA